MALPANGIRRFSPFVLSFRALATSGFLAASSLALAQTAGPSTAPAPTAGPASALPATSPTGTPSASSSKADLARPESGPDSRNLASLVQPLWVDLSPAQQQALAPFAAKWNTFPTNEKRSWVRLADRFSSMPSEQKVRLQARMKDWAEMTPEQRNRARANYNLAAKAPSAQRQAEFEQYRGMTPEQRKVLRSAGKTSNTAALYEGSRSGLAPEASQPLTPEGVAGAKAIAPAKKTAPK
jgi:hypothetical protein